MGPKYPTNPSENDKASSPQTKLTQRVKVPGFSYKRDLMNLDDVLRIKYPCYKIARQHYAIELKGGLWPITGLEFAATVPSLVESSRNNIEKNEINQQYIYKRLLEIFSK